MSGNFFDAERFRHPLKIFVTFPATFFPPIRYFIPKRNCIIISGIIQTTIGIISVLIGILIVIKRPKSTSNQIASGIWVGAFTMIAGVLSIVSSIVPNRFGTRCAALFFCIFTILFSVLAAFVNVIIFE